MATLPSGQDDIYKGGMNGRMEARQVSTGGEGEDEQTLATARGSDGKPDADTVGGYQRTRLVLGHHSA